MTTTPSPPGAAATPASRPRVLVTGGSGFIAGHCILHLLEQGYRVRTTVRGLGREPEVRAQLGDAGMVNGEALSFVAADLTSDAGWADAGVIVNSCGPVERSDQSSRRLARSALRQITAIPSARTLTATTT
ncbi:NAD-dependent epimerase/dehydratase family protein, partial [Streptomyces actuosus]